MPTVKIGYGSILARNGAIGKTPARRVWFHGSKPLRVDLFNDFGV